ncbi:MAG: hypothetical protein HYU67_13590 [Flavobacteriia bacterium]|nr:hypothetical protein [Flavobacteriia bacterium]
MNIPLKRISYISLLVLLLLTGSILFLRNKNYSFKNGKNENALVNDTVPLTKYWESPIPHQKVPKGLSSLSAKSCGACHQEIYNEWKESTHAIAYQDLQFQAELNKDHILTCLNCHTPLQNQLKYIITGFVNGDYKTPVKKKNPNFDKALQAESITCASCHVRDGKVIGAIGYPNTPHLTQKNPEFLKESLCISCHNVVDQVSPVLVCSFETGDEWKNNWASKEGKNCISCHMETKHRPLMPGFPERKGHFHAFPGSGIPKLFNRKTHRLESLNFIESTIPKTVKVNESLNYFITLQNENAGHSVPTGDPERFIFTTFTLLDNKGQVVVQEKHRIGEKWKWYPNAEKLEDNNLKPKEKRTYSFTNEIKNKGKYVLKVEVTKHRMNEENAKFNQILGKYPLSITVFEKKYTIEVL